MGRIPQLVTSRTLRQLGRLAFQLPRRRRRLLLLLLPLASMVALLDLVLISAIARLADRIGSSGSPVTLVAIIEVMALAWLVTLARAGLRISQYRQAAQVWSDLRDRVMARVLGQPYLFHLQHDRTEVAVSLLLHLGDLARVIVTPAVQAITNLVVVAMLGIGLTWLAGWPALVMIALLLLAYGLLAGAVKPPLRTAQQNRMHGEIASHRLVHDGLSNIRSVLLRHRQQAVLDRFNAIGGAIASNTIRLDVLPELPRLLIEPIGLSLVLATALLGSPGAAGWAGTTSLQQLALISLALVRLAQPLQELFRAMNLVQGNLPLMDKALELLELPGRRSDPAQIADPTWPGPSSAPPLNQLGLADVWFRYATDGPWVLQGLNLELPVGGRVALVGPSGSGKSTIAAILLGLLEAEAGGIEVDGERLPGQAITAWQSHCAEVAQPIRLLNGTVFDNVAFRMEGQGSNPGPITAEQEAIWNALEIAQLAGDVRRMPLGLDTPLGEDGQRLSGGQRQRLALARALYQRPRFLLLDEATNALDQRTEAAILRALDSLDRQTTVLLIAHRPNLMRHFDRIHELRGGRIVASGSFNELLERSASFRSLLNRSDPDASPSSPEDLADTFGP